MRGPSRRLLWTWGAGRPARPGPRRPVLFLPRHLPARQPPATDLAQSCPDFSLDIESDSVAGVQTGPIGPRSPEGEDAPAGAMRHGPVLDAPRSASRAPAGVRARCRHPPGAGASAGRCRPRPDFVVIQVGARLLDGTREQVTESGAHWLSKEQEPNQRPVSRSAEQTRGGRPPRALVRSSPRRPKVPEDRRSPAGRRQRPGRRARAHFLGPASRAPAAFSPQATTSSEATGIYYYLMLNV